MPSQHPFRVALRGDDEYDRFLERLRKAVLKDKPDLECETSHQLGEYALSELGRVYGIEAPPRTPPHGTNRYTAASRKKGASKR